MSFDFLDKHSLDLHHFSTEAETEFLVQDFIAKERIVMYWADGGTGKSTLAYALINYIQINHKMRMVTIIDPDNPLDELRVKKVDSILMKYDNLKVIHSETLLIRAIEVLDELVSYVSPDFYKDCLFLLDSAREFVDVDNNKAVQSFMEQVKKLRSAGATVIIIMHGNKDGKNYQGSNHFFNSCDAISKVRKGSIQKDGKFVYIIDTSKGRAGAKSCAFSVNINNYHLEQISYDIATLSNYDAEFIAKVTPILKENKDGINQKNLLEALGLPEDNKAGREALSKFTDKYWKVIKGLKNANFYHLIVEDTAHTEQTGAEHE